MRAAIETLLRGEPGGGVPCQERFAVVTDFDRLILVVGETYGLCPAKLRKLIIMVI